MKFITHIINGQSIAEFNGANITFSTPQQFLQVIMESTAEAVIIHKENIDKSFFDRRNAAEGSKLPTAPGYRWRLLSFRKQKFEGVYL